MSSFMKAPLACFRLEALRGAGPRRPHCPRRAWLPGALADLAGPCPVALPPGFWSLHTWGYMVFGRIWGLGRAWVLGSGQH